MHEQLTPEQQAAYDRAKAAGPHDPGQTRAFDQGPPPDLGLRPRRVDPSLAVDGKIDPHPHARRRPINIELEPGPTIDEPTPADLGQPIAGLTTAVNQETVTALQHYMATQGVELHEAVARLVQMGDLMYRQLSTPNTTGWVARGLPEQVHRGLGDLLRHLGVVEIRLGP